MSTLRVLLFDWSDTVMRVFPGQPGPLAAWPVVAAMPGIKEALAALAPRHILALEEEIAARLGTTPKDMLERLARQM